DGAVGVGEADEVDLRLALLGAPVGQALDLVLHDAAGRAGDALAAQVARALDGRGPGGGDQVGGPGDHPDDRVELLLALGGVLDRAVEGVVPGGEHAGQRGGQAAHDRDLGPYAQHLAEGVLQLLVDAGDRLAVVGDDPV